MKTLWLASAAALLMPAYAVSAQTVEAEAAAAADAQGEIIVTATRRAEALSDVPIAVSAVSMEQLRQSGGNDIRSLNQLAPSLLVSSATNEANGAARIRGVGTVGENPGLESSVAVFIDGVYRSRTGVGLTDLGELDRVEVLRGPQGTLFGRNASAGLISITTARPKFEFGGLGELTYGNFNNWRAMGSLTGPILGDKIAFRVDGVWNKRDGFVTDVISGREINNRDRFLVRGQLLIEPSSDLSIRLIGDYNQKNEECCAAAFINPPVNLSRDANGNVVTSPNTIQALVRSLGGIYNFPTDNSKYVYRTSVTPGRSYDQRTRDWGLSGEINWTLGDVNITSITAYRKFDNNGAQDADFNNVDILYRDNQRRIFSTWTQELRLQGSLFNDRVDWLVGGFFADETLTLSDDIKYGADYDRFVNAQLGGQLANIATAVGYVRPPGQTTYLAGTGVVGDTYRQRSRNYAFFTHNNFQIIEDKLILTLGARYTNERKTLDTTFNHNNGLCASLRAFNIPGLPAAQRPLFVGAQNLSCVINGTSGTGFNRNSSGGTLNEDRFTGTVVLSFKPSEDVLTYASWSRGYKAGGFNLDASALSAPSSTNPTAPPPSANDLRFAAEDVDSFELGTKLSFTGFTLNAALFYQKFSNFQLNAFNGINFEVANIGGCKDDLGGRDRDLIAGNSPCPAGRTSPGLVSKGVELEATFNPVKYINLTAGFTYADTRYAKNLTGSNGLSLAPTLFQLPGQLLSNASPYVVTGSAAWTPPIGNDMSGLVYFDFRYMSRFNTGSDLDVEKLQGDFAVANARIGLYGKDQIWGIELWAQNLFNTLYQQVAADAPLQGSGTFNAVARGLSPTANQLFITFPAEPRTFGVTLRTRF